MHPHVRKAVIVSAIASSLILSLPNGYAQAIIEKPNIEYLGASQGYTFNTATSIIQDRDGFIWIGSLDGLARYDGYRFVTVSDFLLLPNKTIFCIEQAKDGQIWLGHLGGFVTRFDPNTFQSTTFAIPEGKNYDVVKILCDSSGGTWASVRGIGLARFDSGNTFNMISALPDLPKGDQGLAKWYNNISDMVEDDGAIWLGSFNGLYMISKSTLKMKKVSALTTRENEPVAVQALTKIGDIIWVSTYGSGIVRFDTKTHSHEKFTFQTGPAGTNNIVNEIVPLTDHELLLATNGRGIGTFSINTKKFSFFFEPDEFGTGPLASTALVGRAGIVWSTTDKGLLKWNRKENQILFSKVNVTKSDNGGYYGISDIVDDTVNGRRLVATSFADGLHIIDGDRADVMAFKTAKGAEPYMIISDVMVDPKGITWIVTRDDVFTLDKNNRLIEDNSIKKSLGDTLPYFSRIIETSSGDVIVSSTREGAFIKKAGQSSWKRITSKAPGIENDRIMRMIEDRQGRIWFVHITDGVSIFNPATNSLSRISAGSNGLSTNRLTDITLAENGDVWLSSVEGLFVFRNGNPQATHIEEKDGLPSRLVYSACGDNDGNIWITTSKGLSVIDPKNHIRSFDALDGLKGINSSFALRSGTQGRMHILTFQGFYTFYPERLLHTEGVNANTVITGIRNQDLSFQRVGQTTVDYHSNNVTIEFATLNFTNHLRNKYEYRLAGLNDTWIETSENVVNYSALPSGDYTFLVKAFGQPDSSAASVSILVTAPFWRQKWFALTTIVLLVLSSYFLYLRRLRRVRDEEQSKALLKEKLTEMEMKALRAQMSPHFIFNSLNSINRYIVKSDPETASNYLTKFSKLMRLILENSNQKVISLEQELNALKLYIELEALRFNHKFRYSMFVADDVDTTLIGVPPMIIQPFIENAIWHGLLHKDAPGELKINVRRDGDVIQCTIEDNGIGRKRAQELKSKSVSRDKSFGLKITADRLKMANNDSNLSNVEIVDLEDANGNPLGTKVILNITAIELEPEF